jgi:hypothetical protein
MLPTADAIRKALKATGTNAQCPAHDDDHGSLSIGESKGKPLIHCHAGCSQAEVIEALRAKGIWPPPEKKDLTVAELAAEKGLPEQLMRDSGFADDTSNGQDVVRIEYEGANGEILCTRYRAAGKRFWFRKGGHQNLYGLPRLKTTESVILVEGETDSIALWAAGFNALGVPGANAWNERFAEHVESCPTIYVHVEPDDGGQEFKAALEMSRLAAKMVFFTVPGAKDPCELRAKDPSGFKSKMEAAIATAAPASAVPVATLTSAAKDQAPEGPGPWPDPVNILHELSAPLFTGDELPPSLAEYPVAYARATGFDPGMALASALSVAAAAFSDGFQIVGDSKSRWFQQSRLWVINIARPGAGKTPVEKAMLEPLWGVHTEMDSNWRASIKALEENDPKALSKDEPKPPRPRAILVDTTMEALSEALRENPRGLLIANDEFEGWLGGLDAYRRGAVSRDRGEWLRAFDGGPHTVERIQRGSVFVENWGVSILTATTPATLAKLSRSLPEDGLLQRFIPVIGRSRIEAIPVDGLEDMRRRYVETIRRLFEAEPRAHKGCVQLSFEAQTFFKSWLQQNQVMTEAAGTLEPALEAHFSKYPTFLLRITLAFHAANIVNLASDQARDPAAWSVPLGTIETAARFLKRASQHAVLLYWNRNGGSDAYELAQSIGRAILARGWSTVARRDLIQVVHSFRKAAPELQDTTLRLFVDLGWLRIAEGGYSKATPTRYDVNPLLPNKFAAIAERERERRAVVRDLIVQDALHRKGGHANS